MFSPRSHKHLFINRIVYFFFTQLFKDVAGGVVAQSDFVGHAPMASSTTFLANVPPTRVEYPHTPILTFV